MPVLHRPVETAPSFVQARCQKQHRLRRFTRLRALCSYNLSSQFVGWGAREPGQKGPCFRTAGRRIGGYVEACETRTVERWEKLRGLPVRRVPGAGRATVYALITELDEWLENSKPTGVDLAANSAAVDSSPAMTFSPSGAEHLSAITWAQFQLSPEDTGAPPAKLERRSASAGMARAWLTSGRRPLMARLTIAAAVSLLCVLASPVVRSHANPTIHLSKYSGSEFRRAVVCSPPMVHRVWAWDELYLQRHYTYDFLALTSGVASALPLDDFSNASRKRIGGYAPAYACVVHYLTMQPVCASIP